MPLRPLLLDEFARRQGRNPRYSWRSFARSLGMHHTSLRRLVEGTAPPSSRAVERLGARLRLPEARIHALLQATWCERVRQAIAAPGAAANSRALAIQTGLTVDRVNVALFGLLSSGALRFESREAWRVDAPSPHPQEGP